MNQEQLTEIRSRLAEIEKITTPLSEWFGAETPGKLASMVDDLKDFVDNIPGRMDLGPKPIHRYLTKAAADSVIDMMRNISSEKFWIARDDVEPHNAKRESGTGS